MVLSKRPTTQVTTTVAFLVMLTMKRLRILWIRPRTRALMRHDMILWVQWCHVGLQLPDEDAERLGPDVSWVWCHHRLRNRFTPTKRP